MYSKAAEWPSCLRHARMRSAVNMAEPWWVGTVRYGRSERCVPRAKQRHNNNNNTLGSMDHYKLSTTTTILRWSKAPTSLAKRRVSAQAEVDNEVQNYQS